MAINLTTQRLVTFLQEKGGYLPLLFGSNVTCVQVKNTVKKYVAKQETGFLGMVTKTGEQVVEPSRTLSQTLTLGRSLHFQFDGVNHDNGYAPVYFLVKDRDVYVAFHKTREGKLHFAKAQLKAPVVVCTCSVLVSNHAFIHSMDKKFGCGNYEVVAVFGGVSAFLTSSETSEAYSDIKLGALRSIEALTEDFNKRHGIVDGVPVEVFLVDHVACKPFRTLVGRSDKEVAKAIAAGTVETVNKTMLVRHRTMLGKVRDAIDMFMRDSPGIVSVVPLFYHDERQTLQRI